MSIIYEDCIHLEQIKVTCLETNEAKAILI